MNAFEVNGREYTYFDIPALKAARLLIKAQSYLAPLIKQGNGLDSDVSELMKGLDDGVIDDVILPLFTACDLTLLDGANKRKLCTAAQIEVCFPTVAQLADLIAVTKNVAVAQFADFFAQAGSLFTPQGQEEPKQSATRRKLAK